MFFFNRNKVAFAVVVFLLMCFAETAYSFYTLAGRFLVSRLSLTTTLAKLRSLNLPTSTQTIKFFIQRHGKWILLTASVSALMRELEAITSDVCYIELSSTMSCVQRSESLCFCRDSGSRPRDFYRVVCGPYVGPGDVEVLVPMISVMKADRSAYYGFIPVEGKYQLSGGSTNPNSRGEITVEYTRPLARCMTAAEREEVLNREREVRIRVFPNPFDFFQPEIIQNSPSLQALQRLRDQVLSDSSIPLIGLSEVANVFPDVDSLDISIRGDDSEVLPDVPDTARDIPRDKSNSEDASRDRSETNEEDISIPDLPSDVSPVEKRSFPVELLMQLVQSHPILRILSSVSIDSSGGSCEIGSGNFVISFCEHAWVFNIMGAVIVFIATILPFATTRGE